MIKWDSKYELGIAHIDKQHRKLFEIANQAYNTLRDEFKMDKYDDVMAVLEELKAYTILSL